MSHFETNIQTFSGEGTQPVPKTPPSMGRGHSLSIPHLLGAYGASNFESPF